jgi:tetratricopeptide (TPR) repeat protein
MLGQIPSQILIALGAAESTVLIVGFGTMIVSGVLTWIGLGKVTPELLYGRGHREKGEAKLGTATDRNITSPVPSTLFGSGESFTQNQPVESPLGEVLLSVTPNGPTLYVRDRNQAFEWYRQKGFPYNDHKSEVGITWYMGMSRVADQNGIWQEVWAGFHYALAGCLALKKLEDIPDICWHLGRAHTALEQYDLASLYLQAGRKLSEQQNITELTSRILLEEAVLAKLSPQSGNFQSAMESVFAAVFPSAQDSTLAGKAAMTMFQEGMKNQRWRDNRNQPIKSHLIHASGFYEVSLELNRKLGDKQGIAMSLVNLGDVWRKLEKKGNALVCWREALTYLSELGDQGSIGTVNQWIKETGGG